MSTERIYIVHLWCERARLFYVNGERKAKTFKFALGERRSSGLAFRCRVQWDLDACQFTPDDALAVAKAEADHEIQLAENELVRLRARRQALDMVDPTELYETGKGED